MQKLLQSSTSRMSDLDLQRARSESLMNLRQLAVPEKQQMLQSIDAVIEGSQPLGDVLCERIFYQREFDVVPDSFHSWQPPRKRAYNTSRATYFERFGGLLRKMFYNDMQDHERERLVAYRTQLMVYIEMISSEQRDVEVAFGWVHKEEPACALITPLLRTKYDIEIERRQCGATKQVKRRATAAAATATAAYCVSCESSEFVVYTIEDGSVCRGCGKVLDGGGIIDESINALPFDPEMRFENRGSYEITENFMKLVYLMEGVDDGKVPIEVKEVCKSNVRGRKPSVDLVRLLLKQARKQAFYPYATVILQFILGYELEKSTTQQYAQIRHMHEQYVAAFFSLSESERGRSSSLTNNYVAAQIYTMMGLDQRLQNIHMLKGDSKRMEHNRVFKIIVARVRETCEAANVANGTTFWNFNPL